MTWKPQRILAAVDGSEQSRNGAQTAVDIARREGASVTVLTVVRPPEGWWGLTGSPPTPQALADAVLAGQREVLDATIADLDAEGVSIETMEEVGDPAAVILAMCTRPGFDLVVLGRRGAGLVERLMMGSVSDRVAHEAPCPVLIVP